MYINDACNFIFTHQYLSKDELLDNVLTEPKVQSLSKIVFAFEVSVLVCIFLSSPFLFRLFSFARFIRFQFIFLFLISLG